MFAGLLLVLCIPSVLNDGSLQSESSFTVHNMYLELKDVSADWERLGNLLGMSQNRLDVIKRDNDCVDRRYRRMLEEWYNENLNSSWDNIILALNQMGRKRLAKSITEKYAHSECTETDADTEVHVNLENHKERMQELEDGYNELAFEVMTSMEEKEVNLKKVKFWLGQLPVSLKYMHKPFLEGAPMQSITKAESLLGVFNHLGSYWNFLDYGLLEYMAVKFGNDEVKQSMRRYIHVLTSFRKAIPLNKFMKLWPSRIDPPPEFSKLVIRLNRTQSHLTLQDAEEFRLTFAQNYSLVTFALMYGSTQSGRELPDGETSDAVTHLRMVTAGSVNAYNSKTALDTCTSVKEKPSFLFTGLTMRRKLAKYTGPNRCYTYYEECFSETHDVSMAHW